MIDQVQELIALDRTEEALKILRNYYEKEDEHIHNRLINLSAQLTKYREAELDGLPHDPVDLNRIRKALLSILTRMKPGVEIWLSVKVEEGPDKGNEFRIFTPTALFGRDKNNHITLSDPKVSNLHGKIEWRQSSVVYTHLSTSKPTFIRGNERGLKMESGKIQYADLMHDDQLKMGDTLLWIKLDKTARPPVVTSTAPG